jgi:hypothetical protein
VVTNTSVTDSTIGFQNGLYTTVYECPFGFCAGVACEDSSCPALAGRAPVNCHQRSNATALGLVPFYCDTVNGCAANRTGYMCAECQEGFSDWNDACIGIDAVSFFLLLVVVVGLT